MRSRTHGSQRRRDDHGVTATRLGVPGTVSRWAGDIRARRNAWLPGETVSRRSFRGEGGEAQQGMMAVTPAIQVVRRDGRRRPFLPAAIATFVRSLPLMLRVGFAALALGLALDVAYHIAIGAERHEHAESLGTAALAIHLVVVVGMALSLIGLVSAAFTHGRSARPMRRR